MNKLISIIKQAGKIALDEQSNMSVHIKKDGSIVTNGDLATSTFLESELKKLYPDYFIYSEENYSKPTSDKVIVIDPIDGTESYSRKENTWSILVGFIEKGEVVKGVIYQPTEDVLYYGEKGQGSFKEENGVKTKLSAMGTGDMKGIASHKMYGEDAFFNKNNIVSVEHMFSAALKIMKVSEGLIDAYPNFRGKCSLWDLAAPLVILKEAGGDIIFETPLVINYDSPALPMKFAALGKRALKFSL